MNKTLRDKIVKPLYCKIRGFPFVYDGFYVNSLRDFKFVTGREQYEVETQEWINTYFDCDDVFYDVGANLGLFSFLAYDCGCRVFAFEPDRFVFGSLVNNCNLKKADIECFCMGLGNGVSVDSLIGFLPFPNHVKIDTDGFELPIFMGMQRSLCDPRLKSLCIECSDSGYFTKRLIDYGFFLWNESRDNEKNLYYVRE